MSIVCTLEQKVNFFKAAATTKNLLILKHNTDTNTSYHIRQDNPNPSNSTSSNNKTTQCRCKTNQSTNNITDMLCLSKSLKRKTKKFRKFHAKSMMRGWMAVTVEEARRWPLSHVVFVNFVTAAALAALGVL